MDLRGKISVRQDGRSGDVLVSLPGGSRTFWWEFGGGNCIAFVAIPDPAQWAGDRLLAALPREAFLRALADEVAAQQCAGARIEISDQAIRFWR